MRKQGAWIQGFRSYGSGSVFYGSGLFFTVLGLFFTVPGLFFAVPVSLVSARFCLHVPQTWLGCAISARDDYQNQSLRWHERKARHLQPFSVCA